MICCLPTKILFVSIVCGGLGLAGCAPAPSESATAPPIKVAVSYPVEREVTAHADFPARLAAVDCVEVRSRVWGYLEKVHFKEGSLVRKGDVLFELDARPYQAEHARCQAALAAAKALLGRTGADFKRAEELVLKHAMAQSDYDLAKDARDEATAAVQMAEAALNTAKLNLDFTKIIAPVSGRISRYMVTVGNLVQSGDQANATLLTTIVSVDPMYGYFDVDERTVPRVRRLFRESGLTPGGNDAIPLTLTLSNEDGRTYRGTVDFLDNQVNPKTGTLRVRGRLPNKDGTLLPGCFGRVRVPVSSPHRALLVTDRAVDSDQGHKVLYVVDNKNEVVARPIRPGALHDGLRAIEDGLKPDDRVIVSGLQAIRSGMTVEPQVVAMPRHGDRDSQPIQVSALP
jgi:RND family efflux transporter MFP subunit